ncbi:MAG: PEP-CTERM sorting domain-containing protein, partial [Pirellulaceae bacterium]
RNGSLVSLPDTGAVFGPGDFAAALQWDLTLLTQETVVIRGTIGVPLSTIPEPSGACLTGLAVILVLLRRRRPCAAGY